LQREPLHGGGAFNHSHRAMLLPERKPAQARDFSRGPSGPAELFTRVEAP
jgi:hypothetical protein